MEELNAEKKKAKKGGQELASHHMETSAKRATVVVKMRGLPHRLRRLIVSVSRPVWEGSGTLRRWSLTGEITSQGQALRGCSVSPLPVWSFIFLCVDENVTTKLPCVFAFLP